MKVVSVTLLFGIMILAHGDMEDCSVRRFRAFDVELIEVILVHEGSLTQEILTAKGKVANSCEISFNFEMNLISMMICIFLMAYITIKSFNNEEDDVDEEEINEEKCENKVIHEIFSMGKLNQFRKSGYEIETVFNPDEENYDKVVEMFFRKIELQIIRNSNYTINRIFSKDRQMSLLVITTREDAPLAEHEQHYEEESDNESDIDTEYDTDSDSDIQYDSGFSTDSEYESDQHEVSMNFPPYQFQEDEDSGTEN